MDKERIDGFRSAFAPGETLFWQVPAAARERMAFYSENLPRLFSEKITAVFAVSDHYALEFMRFLQGQGIRVPEDVQIIGFDDTLASRESVPALTTIHQDAEEHTEAWRSLDVSLVCGGVLAALFLLTAGGFPAQVLGLYTADDAILRVGDGVLPHRGVLLSAHGGQHRPVRMAALQGTRRCPLLGKFWRGSGEHRAELSAHLRKAGCPRYGRYRCCHRHAGFPAFEPAFDLDRLCGLPSKGSGTPAHRGDLDTVGGRFMFIFRVQRRA